MRIIYCRNDEEQEELHDMAKFLANLEWSEKETDTPTTWIELFMCYKMMGVLSEETKLRRKNWKRGAPSNRP